MSDRIPIFDGWRGIAILMVLFDHLQYSLIHRYLYFWSSTGSHGVNIFFVLSGFLITSRLLECKDLKKFYVRRFFRLMPAAWLFLAIMLFAGLTDLREVALCVASIRNFWGPIGVAGHFWSLSIEEQFYMIWPAIIVFAGKRRGIWIAGIGAVFFGAIHRTVPRPPSGLPTWIYTDGLLIGCFFALLLANGGIKERLAPAARFCVAPSAAVYLCALFIDPAGRASLFENTLVGICISSTFLRPELLASKMVSFRPLAWLGRISYSVYIWQQPFVLAGNVWLLCTAMPAVILASYYCIEKPFTRMGRKIFSKDSSSVQVSILA